MTAIAYRDGIIAADRQVTWGSVAGVSKKIHKINVHLYGLCLVAMSGFVYGEEVILGQLRTNSSGKGEDIGQMQRDSRYGFLITKEMKVHAIYGDGRVGMEEHYENHFIAEGSAFQFLMGAMAAGASAREAVALACDYCDSCGQGIDTVDVREALKDEE